MITFISSLITMIFMRFGPDIPARRMLNHHLVERPLAAARGKKRHHLIFLCIAGALLLFGGDMLLMFGPDFMLAYAADLALYLDIIAVGATASAFAAARMALGSWSRRRGINVRIVPVLARRAARARRARRKSVAAKPVNDEEGGTAWSLAAGLIAA